MFKNKIAVFDIDGTLCSNNTHIDIVTKYHSRLYKSISFRLLSKVFPRKTLNILNRKFNSIPVSYLKEYEFNYNLTILDLLEDYRRKGWFVIIISNAPLGIVEELANRIHVEYIQAPPYKKATYLRKFYSWNRLFVCTDNASDFDLVELSDARRLIINKHNKKIFRDYINEN